MSFFKEFRDFAMRGSLVDMAVAVIMANAFSRVVTSLVDGVIMPVLGKVILKVDFAKYNIVLQEQVKVGDKIVEPEVTVGLGNMITQMIDFVLIALAVFLLIKIINALHRRQDIQTPPSKEEVLLTEIRDLLKK
jgi:large conductance mechanosensitive channel